MHPANHDLPLLHRWRYLWLALVLAAGNHLGFAGGTATVSLGSFTMAPKYAESPTTWRVNLNWSAGYGGYNTVAGWYYTKTTPAGNWVHQSSFNSGNTPPNPKTGTYPYAFPKTEYRAIRLHIRVLGEYGNVLEQQEYIEEFPVDLDPPKKVHLAFTNPSDAFSMTFRYTQNGAVIGETVVPARKSQAITVTVPSDAEVTVEAFINGLTKNDSNWVEQEGAVTNLGRVSSTTGTPISPVATDGTPPETVIVPPTNVPKAGPTSDSTKPVWNNTTATADGERLDKSTFRQGIDALAGAIAANSGKTDMTATNTKLDAIAAATQATQTATQSSAAKLEKMEGYAKEADDRRKELKKMEDDRPNDATQAGAGNAAKGAMSGVFGNHAAPVGPAYAGGGGGAPKLEIAFPAKFGGATINLNPFSSDRFGVVMDWFRSATQWLVLVLLGAWLWKEIAQWTRDAASIPQAKGNTIAMGTGGQATGLVAAGIITTALIVGTTALLAFTFGSVSLGSLLTNMSANPIVGMAGGALWMLEQCLPVGTIITCALVRMAFPMFGTALYATVATTIRFVVP